MTRGVRRYLKNRRNAGGSHGAAVSQCRSNAVSQNICRYPADLKRMGTLLFSGDIQFRSVFLELVAAYHLYLLHIPGRYAA